MTAPLVVMLSAAHPPDDVRVVRKEGAALAAAGWRVVHVAPAATHVSAAVAGVALWPYARRPGWLGRLRGVPALARMAAASGAAVLHASEPDAWFAALLAARRTGARVVIDVHEHYPSRLDHRLPAALRPILRWAIRRACRIAAHRADAVVVAKDGLDEDFAVPGRTIAVRNYAAMPDIAPRIHTDAPLRLLHLGALGATRGALLLPDVLAQSPPGTVLTLVGRFTDDSQAAFFARAEALGVADRIHLTGWMPAEAALAETARHDIGLVLFQPGVENHRLALPHKLFDCMAAGLPVIAPAFAEEVATVVREARCGVLVDVADAAAVAQAIGDLQSPARRAALGAAGRAAVAGRFGWAAEAARLVELYERLAPLARHPPPAISSAAAPIRASNTAAPLATRSRVDASGTA